MRSIIATVIAISLLPVPALAAEEKAPPPEGEKMICKREKTTGSRLSGEKVCRTEQEWRVVAEDYRRMVRRWQGVGFTNGQN